MNDLIKQALKDLDIGPKAEMYGLLKLWLEKMYLCGNVNAIEEMQKFHNKK